MSNRTLKLKLWNEDNRCHWCRKPTILTDTPFLKGNPNPLTATIDHIVSRLNPGRWVQKKSGQRRKVLACYSCNHNRSVQETLCLSRHEILKRSRGFSLSPRGKPRIIKPVKNVKEALDKLNSFGNIPA